MAVVMGVVTMVRVMVVMVRAVRVMMGICHCGCDESGDLW